MSYYFLRNFLGVKNLAQLLIPFLIFIQCCSQSRIDEKEIEDNNVNTQPPAEVTINRSTVFLRVEEVIKNDTGLILRAVVTGMEADEAYQSLAENGRTYTLTPLYYIDEEGNMPDNERNRKFQKLSSVKKGEKIKAIIFFDRTKGWFIQDIIN